jgi:hypothetical protein
MRVNQAWLGLAVLMLPTLLVAMDMTALLLALPPAERGPGRINGPHASGRAVTMKNMNASSQMMPRSRGR